MEEPVIELSVEVLLGVKPKPKPVVDVTLTGSEMDGFMSFREGIVLVDSFARSAPGTVEL